MKACGIFVMRYYLNIFIKIQTKHIFNRNVFKKDINRTVIAFNDVAFDLKQIFKFKRLK